MKQLRRTIRKMIIQEGMVTAGQLPEGKAIRIMGDRESAKIEYVWSDDGLPAYATQEDPYCWGYIKIEKYSWPNRVPVWEVLESKAGQGYGPTLYDCVMELTDGIINDRASVSNAAKKVMHRYKNSRPDVEKTLLDNIDDKDTYPRTPDTGDDCTPGDSSYYRNGRVYTPPSMSGFDVPNWEDDPLSYSYDKPLSPTVAQWKQKGDDFIKQMEATGNLFYTDLRGWAREMFQFRSLWE